MLSKKERLSRDTFNRFFSLGKRHHSPYWTLIYAPAPTFHASVVVPKKIARLAVNRNRMRRRIYDIVRLFHKEQKIQGVFIFLVKAPALPLTHEVLKMEVRSRITETQKIR